MGRNVAGVASLWGKTPKGRRRQILLSVCVQNILVITRTVLARACLCTQCYIQPISILPHGHVGRLTYMFVHSLPESCDIAYMSGHMYVRRINCTIDRARACTRTHQRAVDEPLYSHLPPLDKEIPPEGEIKHSFKALTGRLSPPHPRAIGIEQLSFR